MSNDTLLTAGDVPKSNPPKQHRLTDTDKAFALRYAHDGLTQGQIAQRLGVTQPAISQWLSKCQDTTADAGLFLRGRALHLSERLVKHAKPADIVQTLKGLQVLRADDPGTSVTIQIGIKDSDVRFTSGHERQVSDSAPVVAVSPSE